MFLFSKFGNPKNNVCKKGKQAFLLNKRGFLCRDGQTEVLITPKDKGVSNVSVDCTMSRNSRTSQLFPLCFIWYCIFNGSFSNAENYNGQFSTVRFKIICRGRILACQLSHHLGYQQPTSQCLNSKHYSASDTAFR